MMADGEDEYFLPLRDQRVFGAGIKRKRVTFVPAVEDEKEAPRQVTVPTQNPGDRYLSIVLPEEKSSPKIPQNDATLESYSRDLVSLCSICDQPIPSSLKSHQASIAHQLHLAHSRPPSHLDRQHVGVKYLSNYGWDPDAPAGLGAREDGIRIPIKGKVKSDTTGLGLDTAAEPSIRRQIKAKNVEEPVLLLNAKQVRRQDAEAREKAKKLRATFYGPDLSQYL